jgi:hypothetical protein
MKVRMYSNVLNLSSGMLNYCIKKQWWGLANRIIQFRKNNVSKPLRDRLTQTKPTYTIPTVENSRFAHS